MRVYKNENVINVEFGTSSDINIEKMLYQWNKGQILHFLDIPKNAEIQFSNKNAENTINKLLNNGNVEIPNTLLETTDELFCVVQYISWCAPDRMYQYHQSGSGYFDSGRNGAYADDL